MTEEPSCTVKTEAVLETASGSLAVVKDTLLTGPTGRVALICHGLTGEKSGPGGVLRGLGETVARSGWDVYRWDLPGAGDSTGDLSTVTYQELVDSVVDVAMSACHDSPTATRQISLVGHSVGAVIAASASEILKPGKLVLIASDLSPGSELPTPEGGKIRGGAFRLSSNFWQQRQEVDPLTLLTRRPESTLFIAAGDDDKVMAALNRIPVFHKDIVHNCGHLFIRSSHRAQLFDKVVRFLNGGSGLM